ncbi:SMI1/KNR4 family protein [Stenotrophomonas sp.]|uniref:SMI1/KNR4 family protein n=1 Tax=Stenotrophomonas sp. TaxID=69392 RepID=UPI0028964E7D|nr:SMI1/KNR4 family protein [Stenotrophomonas sp.]
MRELNWFEPGQGASESEVSELEGAIGLRLPKDFTEFVIKNAGASNPDESEFDIADLNGKIIVGNLGFVLPISSVGGESVAGALSDLSSQIQSGLVPVIGTGSGDFVCLDFRSGCGASVTYFFHERSGVGALVPLSSTFTDFLNTLREPADDF